MDDLKASSVVIWGTAVSHVDPPWLWFQIGESLAILGWNKPCCPTTILLMTIPTWGPYFRAARLIGAYGGWFRLGKSTSSNTFHWLFWKIVDQIWCTVTSSKSFSWPRFIYRHLLVKLFAWSIGRTTVHEGSGLVAKLWWPLPRVVLK